MSVSWRGPAAPPCRCAAHCAGAELAGLCREAALAALREDFSGAAAVAARHFEAARLAIRPALTPTLLAKYEGWSRQGAAAVAGGGGTGAAARPAAE